MTETSVPFPSHLMRMILEYIELRDRLNKLERFIGGKKYEELPEGDQNDLVMQGYGMREYLSVLSRRLNSAGIDYTAEDEKLLGYCTFNFSQALDLIKKGYPMARMSWNNTKFVCKQITSKIPKEHIQLIKSLPDSVKIIMSDSNCMAESIHYNHQFLLINYYTGEAKGYVATCSDLYAEDWYLYKAIKDGREG